MPEPEDKSCKAGESPSDLLHGEAGALNAAAEIQRLEEVTPSHEHSSADDEPTGRNGTEEEDGVDDEQNESVKDATRETPSVQTRSQDEENPSDNPEGGCSTAVDCQIQSGGNGFVKDGPTDTSALPSSTLAATAKDSPKSVKSNATASKATTWWKGSDDGPR